MHNRTELLDYDPITKTKTLVHFSQDAEEFIVEDVHDVTDVVEDNKAAMAATNERARWADGLGSRVGSIPIDIYQREVAAKGMTGKDLLKWLMDPIRSAFRTRPGKLA